MNQYVLGLVSIIALASCKATTTEQYPDLPLIEGELLSSKWEALERFPPLFPIENALAGKEGCASVEYVITKNNEIKDIKVVNSTNKYFAKQAKLTIQTWNWSELPKGIIDSPIKTNTQFEYCLESGDGHCKNKDSFVNTECKGKDTLYSIAYKVKRHG